MYIYFDASFIEYLKLKIWMRMHHKIYRYYRITFQKKIFFADRKINLFKNCSKISHVTVTFVGVDFFVRTFFAADKFITKVANLNIPGLI